MSTRTLSKLFVVFMLLLTSVTASFPVTTYASGSSQVNLGVDAITGVPAVPVPADLKKSNNSGALFAPQATLLDDFNRANGPLGANWTLRTSITTTAFNVVSNTARGGTDAIATYNLLSGVSGAEIDVLATGTNFQYVGMVLDYNPTTNNKIYIKVQSQDSLLGFERAGCYTGSNNPPTTTFGLGFFPLTTPITSARMRVSLDITRNVTIQFLNIDGGAGTQTYTCLNAPFTGGNQTGLVSRSLTDGSLDNFSVLNAAPVANDESYTLAEDNFITVAAPGVLGNDSDLELSPLTAVLVSNVSSGTLTLAANGAFTYTPVANFFGTDTFIYSASDGALTDTATVTLTVTPTADPPVANNDAYVAIEDTPLNINAPGVLSNDVDPDGTPLTVTLLGGVTNGTLTLRANGSFIYTPTLNFFGTDSFTYVASDGVSVDPALVTITVDPANDIPVAVNNTYAITEDVTLNVSAPGVLGNDIDVEMDPLFAFDPGPVSHGALALQGNGAFSYTPVANYTGIDVFTYRVTDGDQALYSEGLVTITITPINDPPSAVDDVYTTTEDAPLSIPMQNGVLVNDAEYDGTPISATLQTNVTHGGLVLNPNGSFIYVPVTNYYGPDNFTYSITDGVFTATAIVTINVTPVNDPPLAIPNAYTTTEDAQIVVPAPGVLGNDSDVEGSPLTSTIFISSAQGTVVINPNGAFTFTPVLNFFGTTVFTYAVSDGSLTSTAPVTLTFTPLPDAPIANADTYNTPEENVLTVSAPGVLANDIEPDFEPMTASLVSGVSSGVLTFTSNGAFTYTPVLNFFGIVGFTYRVSDGVLSSTAVVSITVSPVNDIPIANDDPYTITRNIPLIVPFPGVMANDVEPDLQPLTITLVSGTSNGTLSLQTDGTFTYTPNLNFTGTDNFTYRLSDSTLLTDTATVFITVTSFNNAPNAIDDAYTTAEDTMLSVDYPGVLGNDTDPERNVLRATLFSGPAHGSLTLNLNGSFSYTPSLNYFGLDSFVYQVTDGILTDTATATINVTPVGGDAPVANDDVYTGTLNIPLVIPAPGVMANDVEPDREPLTATLISGVGSGTLTFRPDGGLTYTPTGGFTGNVTFVYSVTDGVFTDSATVTLTITAANTAPVANDNTYSTTEDSTLVVPFPGVLGNDTDADGNVLRATTVSTPANGSLVLDLNGAFTYTPAANYFGTDTFVYQAFDGVLTDTALVTITVAAGNNDTPVANDDVYTTTKNVVLNLPAPGVLSNDVEPDGSPMLAILQSGVSSGTLTFQPNGSLIYTPALNFTGTVSFVYITSDGLFTDTATTSINVIESPAPLANDDVYITSEDVALNVVASGVLSNDVSALTATVQTSPTNGLLTLNINGGFVYTPNLNFVGLDAFTYTARNGLLTDTAIVTITVTAVNDAPDILPMLTQTVNVNKLSAITVVLTDVDTLPNNLTFTVTSSVQSILPNSNIVVNGAGYTRTLSVTPILTGTTIISMTVMDNGGQFGSRTFNLVVVPSVVYIPFVWKPLQ